MPLAWVCACACAALHVLLITTEFSKWNWMCYCSLNSLHALWGCRMEGTQLMAKLWKCLWNVLLLADGPSLLTLEQSLCGFAKLLWYPQDVWSKVAQASHTVHHTGSMCVPVCAPGVVLGDLWITYSLDNLRCNNLGSVLPVSSN